MRIIFLAIGIIVQFPLTVLASNAIAQDRISTQALLECKAINSDRQRLACLDLLLSNISPTPLKGPSNRANADDIEAPIPSTLSIEPTAEEKFGLNSEQLKEQDAPTEISSAVKEILLTKSGRYVIRLENGQEWRQLKSNTKKLFFKGDGNGLRVKIKEKLLGSFSLSLDGSNRSIRVNRKK